MQRRAGCETKPANVTRVRRNLRLYQNNVEHDFRPRITRMSRIELMHSDYHVDFAVTRETSLANASVMWKRTTTDFSLLPE
jgi:hypothetical protein